MIDEKELVKIHNNHTNRELAVIFNTNHTAISNTLKRLGLETNRGSRRPIQMVNDKEAKCRKCNEVKSIDEFTTNRKGQKYEYKLCYCFSCRRKQQYSRINSCKDTFLNDRFNKLALRAKMNNTTFTITKDEFIAQFHKQNGLCFYTDITLVLKVGQGSCWESVSVDKIIPEIGYTKENTVFCSNRINTMKNDATLEEMSKWMPDWFKRIQEHIAKK